MTKPDETPKRLLNSLDRIKRNGGVVMKCYGSDGGDPTFQFLNGKFVTAPVVGALLSRGLLVSQQDGLFPATPQSFRVA